jgi:hypothetical protein
LEGEPSWMAGGLPIRTTAHTNPAEIAGHGALRCWLQIRTQLGRFLSGLLYFYLDCSNCPGLAMIRLKGAAFQRGITSRSPGPLICHRSSASASCRCST